MTDQPTRRLSAEEIIALKFAAHRQLARWSNKPRLSPHQHAQRNALKRAVRILQDDSFTLVALATVEHGADLASRDARAKATYDTVGVRVIVAE